MPGGGQERRRRGGTENVAGDRRLRRGGAKWRRANWTRAARWQRCATRLESGVLAATPEAIIVGRDAPRLANTSCIAWPGKLAETLVIRLDLAGIAVSAGLGLFVRQGGTEPRAGGDGPDAGDRGRRRADQPRAGRRRHDDMQRFPRRVAADPRGARDAASHGLRRRAPAAAARSTGVHRDGGSSRDDRAGPRDRRRQVQVRLRDRHRERSRPRRAWTRTPSASSRRRRASRSGCSNGGSRPIGAGAP